MASEIFSFVAEFDDKRSLEKLVDNLEKAEESTKRLLELAGQVSGGYDKTVQNLKKGFQQVNTELKSVEQNIKAATSGKTVSEAVAKNEQLKQTYKGLEQEATRLNNSIDKLQKTNKKLLEVKIREQHLRNQEKKQIREQIKDEEALNIVLNRQVKSQKDLREVTNAMVRLRDKLDVTTAKGRKKWDEYTKAIASNTQRLKENDAQIGRFQRNVGNYQTAIDGLRKRFNQLATLAGVTGGIFLLQRAMRASIGVVVDYDESLANLEKTTNQSTEEVERMALAIRKFDTRTSITDLLGLATAGGRLGLTGNDVVEFTQSVDKAFVALGDTLEGTADEIGLTLGKISSVFGVESEFGIGEGIERVGSALNELGANSKATEGNIIDFTNRLAGVASQADISVTDIAALGTLFDETGQSMEVAATTLNKLLPALGKDVERFAKVAGLTTEEFRQIASNSPIEALQLVAKGARSSEKGLIGLNKVLENYGVDSARAAGIVAVLSSETERLGDLQEISNKAFEDNISLQTEFEKKNKTVGASIDKLNKGFQEQVLRLSESIGLGDSLSGVIDTLTNNLGGLLKVLLSVIGAFVTYKIAATAAQVATGLYTAVTKTASATQLLFSGNTKKATQSLRVMNRTMSLSPFGLLFTGLAALTTALVYFGDGAADAAEKQESLNNAMERGIEFIKEMSKETDKITSDLSKKNQQRIDMLRAQGASEEEIQAVRETQLTKEIEVNDQVIANQTARINNTQAEIDRLKALKQQIDDNAAALKKAERETAQSGGSGLFLSDSDSQIGKLTDEQKKLNKELGKATREIIKSNDGLIMYETTETAIVNMEGQINNLTKERNQQIERGEELLHQMEITTSEIVTKQKELTKEEKKAADQRAKELLLLKRRLEDLRDAAIRDPMERTMQQLRRKYDREKAAIIGNTQVEQELRIELEKALTRELLEVWKKFHDEVTKDAIEQVDKEREELKKKREGIIEDNFDQEMKVLEKSEKQTQLSNIKKIEDQKELDKTNLENKIKFLEEELEIRKYYGKETIDVEIEIENAKKELRDKELKDLQSFYQEVQRITDQGIKAGFDKAKQDSDDKTALLNKELDMQARNVSVQQALAEQGAQNTFAFEQNLQREKEKALLEEQKRLEKIKKIETYYNLFSAYANDPNTDPAQAAGKALIQLGIGEGIAALLEDGGVIEDQVKKQHPKDGIFKGKSHKHGGIKVEVEGSEGILSKKEMRNIGKERFYGLKSILADPGMTNDFFERSNSRLIGVINNNGGTSINGLKDELKSIKDELHQLPHRMPKQQTLIDEHGQIVTKYELDRQKKTTIHKRRFT